MSGDRLAVWIIGLWHWDSLGTHFLHTMRSFFEADEFLRLRNKDEDKRATLNLIGRARSNFPPAALTAVSGCLTLTTFHEATTHLSRQSAMKQISYNLQLSNVSALNLD